MTAIREINTTKLALVDQKIQELQDEVSRQNKIMPEKSFPGKNHVFQKRSTEISARASPSNQTSFDLSTNTNENYNENYKETVVDITTELIICIDSNSQFLDYRKLWTLKGTKVRRCGNIKEVNNVINDNVEYRNLNYFLISVGCNDLDAENGDVVFSNIKDTFGKLKRAYPNIKVILNEITPRMDNLDAQVKATNTLLNQFVDRSESTYITMNSNLRDPDFFYDNKHFREESIGRFAANIKKALRSAYGIQYERQRRSNDQQQYKYDGRRTHSNYVMGGQAHDDRIHKKHEYEKMKVFKDNLLLKIIEALQHVGF